MEQLNHTGLERLLNVAPIPILEKSDSLSSIESENAVEEQQKVTAEATEDEHFGKNLYASVCNFEVYFNL